MLPTSHNVCFDVIILIKRTLITCLQWHGMFSKMHHEVNLNLMQLIGDEILIRSGVAKA